MNAFQLYLQLQKEIEQAPIIPPCQNTDPELWFGAVDINGISQQANYKEAKKLCGLCPVQNTCLQYALEANEIEGVWGGLSPEERKRIRWAADRTWQRRQRTPKYA